MNPAVVLLLAAFATLPYPLPAAPQFIDRANAQPFSHVYDGGWEHTVGGGVAVFDCNADHLPELFVAGGANPAKLLINRTGSAGSALRFQPLAATTTDLKHVIGAYPLDVDSDGQSDLFVLRVGENRILKGLGDCRFADASANATWNFTSSDAWSTAFSATWESGAILPTLAVGNYVDRDNPAGPFAACADNQLYRPLKSSRYSTPIALTPSYCALSMLFSDWGRNGKVDLRISNDRHYYVRGGEEQLVQLAQPPRFYRAEDGWKPLSIWGMGISSRDISADGLPEIFLTSMADQKLLSLAGDGGLPTYTQISYQRGTTAQVPYLGDEGRPSTGWHAEFGDVNNDGLDDLFIAKGNVDQMPDAAMRDPNNLLMQQLDGRFVEAGGEAGVGSVERARGAAVVDLNLDGKLDIVVVNRRANMAFYENITTPTGNWLKLELQQHQPAINRAAVGAWIEVKSGGKTWSREITVGGGHASGRSGFEHFGLADANSVSYQITWPDGVISDWRKVVINQHIIVTRNQTALLETRF